MKRRHFMFAVLGAVAGSWLGVESGSEKVLHYRFRNGSWECKEEYSLEELPFPATYVFEK